jgi:hypothetical protein
MRAFRAVVVVGLGGLVACGGNVSPTGLPSPTPTAASCAVGSPAAGVPSSLAARLVASGLHHPLDLQHAPGDRERLYVVEQGGTIRVMRNGQLAGGPFLDVSSRISSGGERGLLGLAFHPRFAANGRLFVNYTDRQGDTHIAEFHASSPDVADPASEQVLLTVAQPFANHNGGGLAFDNSGRLLVALGDGGSGGDPFGNGQRLDTLLGKILRIDVDAGAPYAVPADNPFASTPGARPEIWAYGLRNPFRIAVDGPTGDLYIGDVGQSRVEEIDVERAPLRGGQDYGWNIMEGSQCYRAARGCNSEGLTLPVYEYTHSEGCSVTGGVVYRGCRMPDLAGAYFFADYCSGFVRSFRVVNGQATDLRDWTAGLAGIDSPTSFGLDAEGEVYVVDYDGEVYRLEPGA